MFNSQHIYTDVLIVTVTPVESRAVLQAFEQVTSKKAKSITVKDRTYRDLGIVNGSKVFMAFSRMGSSALGASTQTVQEAVQDLSPHSVIMIGIAFGMNESKQAIGDVLVSNQLMLYESQRIDLGEISRGDKVSCPDSLYKYLYNAHLDWTNAEVRFGVVLTGEKLIDKLDYRESLKKLENEAIGGEMEGAGLYVSCQKAKVDWILVKAICDWADGNKNEDKEQHQQLAAKNAAEFVVYALQHASLERPYQAELSLIRKISDKNNNLQALQEILKPVAQNLSDEERIKFNSICLQYVSREAMQSNFFDTLSHLFNLGKLSKGQYPILCVINHLIKENIITGLVREQLINWLKNTAINWNVELQTIDYTHIKEDSKNECNYLTIQLKRDEGNLYSPQAWLNGDNKYSDDITKIELKNGDEKPLQPLMDRLLKEIIYMENETLIEFILPKELMYYHFDKLKNNNYKEAPAIGVCYQLVIQALDRREHKEYFPKWKNHWKNILQEKILSQKVKDKLVWLKQEEHNRILASMTEIKPEDKKCCFGLNFKFSTCQKNFLDELIMWGAFAALWSCQHNDINLEEDVANFLDTQIINLPKSIYSFRCHHRDKDNEKYITLFWDTPDRLPPPLPPNFLGKEFRKET